MAFEFRDILPAVGAVIGFGFGGPGGAALGSGIGSLARGDEADEALKNAALGYVGGKGTQFLGSKIPGVDKFLSGVPGGSFVQGGMDKDIFGSAIGKGKEFLGIGEGSALEKAMANYDTQVEIIANSGASDEAKAQALKVVQNNMEQGLDPSENLLSIKNLLGVGTFATLFGGYLDKQDKGTDFNQFMVTTDTPLKGFENPTQIKKVSEFAADGGLMSLAQGGFPRKRVQAQKLLMIYLRCLVMVNLLLMLRL